MELIEDEAIFMVHNVCSLRITLLPYEDEWTCFSCG